MTSSTASAVPVWLLDVDGVVNVSKPGWGAAPHSGCVYLRGSEYRMRFARGLTDAIARPHVSGAAEVRWCTSWCPHVDLLQPLFRMPKLAGTLTEAELDEAGVGERRNALKYKVAAAVLQQERRPLIWTDDEAVPLPNDPARSELEEAGPPTLLLRPSPRRGLTRDDMAAITTFAAQLVT